jgi:hypothetical protein
MRRVLIIQTDMSRDTRNFLTCIEEEVQ